MDSQTIELAHAAGRALIEELGDGRRRICVVAHQPDLFVTRKTWVTRYPINLIEAILMQKGLSYLCDEIARDEDPSYVQHHILYDVLSYIDPQALKGKRLLDFGCGSGASTMVLSRMIPGAALVGVELGEQLLGVAKRRAEYYGAGQIEFRQSPSGPQLPPDLGLFDAILLSAVYEHLLPGERRQLLPLLWSHLAPGGILFLNQTPYRYAPMESHTTDLPLINFLPDGAAGWMARTFSRRIDSNARWEDLLRAGIRGGRVSEILSILRAAGCDAELLKPRFNGIQDRIDLWYQATSSRWRIAKNLLCILFKGVKAISGIEMAFSLSLALQKPR